MRIRCSREMTVLAVLLAVTAGTRPAEGKVYQTQEEALSAAFPAPADVQRRNLFMEDSQAERVERESGEKVASRLVTYYVGVGREGVLGYAYFDTHRVRTLPETIMVVVRPDGTLGRISILSFSEPEDYLPKRIWLDQFTGRSLDAELALRRGIRNLTGASLTADAITSACRRILAIHHLVREKSP